MKSTIMLLAIVGFVLTGCVVGNKIDYTSAQLSVKYPGTTKLAFGIQDKRTYIVTKNKDDNFVGVYRGGFGNPFNVTTSSKKSLSEDIAVVVSRVLNIEGAHASPIIFDGSTSDEEISRTMKNNSTPKALVITINEWKSDSTNSFAHRVTNFDFNLVAVTYDHNGIQLAKKVVKGTEQVSGGAFAGFSYVESAAPNVLKSKLEELLSGDISSAINSN
ncbi:MAG: hypothetical protein HZB47_07555 [Nitrosomonadales bacterium]|nr:hypothetical protein [Nitrosomonadales bacterium]